MGDGTLDLTWLDAGSWQRVEMILDQVLDLSPQEVRPALDRLCAGDPVLRARIEALLWMDARAEGRLTGFWQQQAKAAIAKATSGEDDEGLPDSVTLVGHRIGPWKLGKLIGRGGMGVVYLAERDDGQYEQRVAVKILGAASLAIDALTRFLQERRVLARLEHPHIARILDGGVTDSGLWWFALEYVPGAPITKHCEERELGLDAILDLFLQAASAVQFAHTNLVIHRDLKPGNIFVSERGEVKLLDFGIAKLLDPSGEAPEGTIGWHQALTPGYAAPEQLVGERPTTGTDVYGLAAVLYELLTGTRVVAGETVEEARVAALEQNVEPPSMRIARSEDTRRRGWGARVRGDLDNILLTALRKAPAERYASVEAFADDVRRYRAGLPVRASGRTFGYVASKFARRHRAPVAVGAILVLAVAVGFLGLSRQARVAARERDAARAEAGKALTLRSYLKDQARGEWRKFQFNPQLASAGRLDLMADIFRELGDSATAAELRASAKQMREARMIVPSVQSRPVPVPP